MHPTCRFIGALYDTLTFAVFCLLWDANGVACTEMHIAFLMHVDVKLVRVALTNLAKIDCVCRMGSISTQAWHVQKQDATSATLSILAKMHTACNERLTTIETRRRNTNVTYVCPSCHRRYTELEIVEQLMQGEATCRACSVELADNTQTSDDRELQTVRDTIREWLRPWTETDDKRVGEAPLAHIPGCEVASISTN